jgi:hypothetical protein
LMSYEEIVRGLGPQVAADAVSEEAIKKLSRERNEPMAFPPIETRQRMFRDQRDAELRKLADNFQARQKKLQSVRDDAAKFLQESRAEEITVLLARAGDTGRWLTIEEGSAHAVAIFQNTAFYDDFTEARGWSCEPERITIKDLFARFGELPPQGIDSLTLDRCPRCHDVRQVIRLAQIDSEADLLRLYAAMVAGKRVLIEEKLDTALHETDQAKRLAGLQYIVEHMDPAHAAAYLEIARIAAGSRDAGLFEHCKTKLSRYQPQHVASLAVFPV